MSSLSVNQTAAILGVSERRVRTMIADELLAAERVGGRWILTDSEVVRFKDVHRKPGRPYSSAHAWGLLSIAGHRDPAWLSRRDQQRLASVLAGTSIEGLAPSLRRRAEPHAWYVHPSLLTDLAEDRRVVVGGHGATRKLHHTGPGLLYLSSSDLDTLAEEYRPMIDATDPNVIMQSIHSAWPFRPGEHFVWDAVAAVDLLEVANDDRATRVARELLEAMDA